MVCTSFADKRRRHRPNDKAPLDLKPSFFYFLHSFCTWGPAPSFHAEEAEELTTLSRVLGSSLFLYTCPVQTGPIWAYNITGLLPVFDGVLSSRGVVYNIILRKRLRIERCSFEVFVSLESFILLLDTLWRVSFFSAPVSCIAPASHVDSQNSVHLPRFPWRHTVCSERLPARYISRIPGRYCHLAVVIFSS